MFTLRRLLEAVMLKPLMWILLLLLVLVFWKRKWARKILLLTILLVALLHSGPVAQLMKYGLESRFAPLADISGAGSYDAIVVLNGDVVPATGLIPYPSLGIATFRRLEEALRLYRLNPVPIIVSGGPAYPSSPTQNKNTIACGYLLAWGVAAGQVIPEPNSIDTLESAREVNKILRRMGWRRYLLVTSAAHMPRSMLVFRRLAPEPVAAPGDFNVSGTGGLLNFLFGEGSAYEISTSIHEYVGLAVYCCRLWFERR